jgi:O-antigen ligase
MFFERLNNKNSLSILLIHILLGGVSIITPLVLSAWLWVCFFMGISYIMKLSKDKTVYSFLPLAYIGGMELAARVAKTSPLLPYEFAKYFYLFFLIICIYRFNKFGSSLGLMILILLIPSLFFIPIENYRIFFVNSFLGIFLLGLMAYTFHDKFISVELIKNIFRFYLYGLITLLILVIGKTGELSSIEFELGANFSTAGGFGSNQVSTYLGIGAMLFGIMWLLKWDLFKLAFINISFLIIFILRAILTFSRGGVIGALLSVLVAYLIPKPKIGVRKVGVFSLLLMIFSFLLSFIVINDFTNGLLLQRYQGETSSTISGKRDVDLNTVTSRRSSLVETEWQIFIENPIFGVGPGGGFEAREKFEGLYIASHTEVTRLLAEHGVFGLIISLIFIFYPLFHLYHTKNGLSRFLSTAFFMIAILTSFHAAMRTTVTPFFWSLGCARFII